MCFYCYGGQALLPFFSYLRAEQAAQGKGVDLLFGLDMLKRYQACIDLSKNALVIQGRDIRFLSEHELPKGAFDEELEVDEQVVNNRQCVCSS